MEHLKVDSAVIEFQVQGVGEPVLLIAPSLVRDGLGYPLLAEPELASRYRLIHYHRRGYGGSTLGSEPLTFARHASDAAALLKHLGVKSAHVAGHSSGGGIALQLAMDAPDLVHSLVLMEPALNMVAGGKADLEHLFLPVLTAYRAGNKRKAVETFCDAVFGPGWQPIVEKAIPGSTEKAIEDTDTFFKELSDIQEWQFGPTQAAAITQPVLSVLGTNSSPFMQKGREVIHAWLPQAEDFDPQTNHLLQLQDPQGVARGLAAFFARHPIEVKINA